MRPTVLLFDIDGTLISTGGVGRRAIERAFEQRYGRAEALSFSFGGMTDRAIVRDALASVRPELDGAALEAEIDAVLASYLIALEEESRRATGFRVHSGVHEALDRARERARCAIGLGTGNVKRGAQIKLERVGLFESFRFGGFGCDHVLRSELLRIGARRGAEQLGVAPEQCRVVVIGDTVKDVQAAHAIGAECIAVATGASSVEALRGEAPRLVCADLTERGALDVLLDVGS